MKPYPGVPSVNFLRRYTTLPWLAELLRSRCITLLDPRSWDDSNDSYYLDLHKQKKQLKSVLALCFTQAPETYHYWHVFAAGPEGACIQFKRQGLIRAVTRRAGIRGESMQYPTLEQMRGRKLAAMELPFLKRYGFQDEQEFRFIHASKTKALRKLKVPIPLSCIDRIMLSPKLPATEREQRKSELRSIRGCAGLEIYRSTLTGNRDWKRLGEKAI